jgi:hypothetical protein
MFCVKVSNAPSKRSIPSPRDEGSWRELRQTVANGSKPTFAIFLSPAPV